VHVNCQVFCIANFLFLFMVLQVPVPPMALPGTAFVVPEPLGVALVIAPWNFPLCKPKVCLLSQMAQFFCVSLLTLL
jgi:hypothetical protein